MPRAALIIGGFATEIQFDGESVFCDTFGIGDNSGIIESAGAYGGDLLNTAGNMAIKTPHIMDYGQVSGNIGFTPVRGPANTGQLGKVIAWVRDIRHEPKNIVATTGATGVRTYAECYFNSVAVTASEGSIVNVDVGFDIIEPIYQDGSIDGAMRISGGTVPNSDDVSQLIPYWETGISKVPSADKMTDWSLNFSQDIVKKVFCSGLDEDTVEKAPLPSYVLFGPLSIDVSYTVVVPSETDVSTLYLEYAGEAQLRAGNDIVNMERLTIQSENPEITETAGYIGYQIGYNIYKITP